MTDVGGLGAVGGEGLEKRVKKRVKKRGVVQPQLPMRPCDGAASHPFRPPTSCLRRLAISMVMPRRQPCEHAIA